MIYAHSTKDGSDWELLEEHSQRVADAAAWRASYFDGETLARIVGLAHDLGKVKKGFQAKLAGARNDVTHAGEGALLLSGRDSITAMLAGIVAGHHGRLPNPARLARTLDRSELIGIPDWCALPEPVLPGWINSTSNRSPAFRLQFLQRMLYSCLTDADDRETARFYGNDFGRPDVVTSTMRDAFDIHMAGMRGTRPIDDLRREVLAHARAQAAEQPGLFTLTVPTGGGKTLTSLGFGLDHALAHKLRRIVFVIPYLSIVEQTADVFRGVLGNDAVLEHHSSFDTDRLDESEAEMRRVAKASWDVPVVVTTAVQFFESLYAARKKRCRKLNALAGSVIVIDEAQTMPLGFLRPCLASLTELIEGYGASVVLCTATQPALTAVQGFPAPEAFTGAREIAPDPERLYRKLKRVEVRDIGPLDDAALADRMCDVRQVLTIVDNRAQARGIFDAIRDTEGAAHLSTLMTAAHRRATLAEIRQRLAAGGPVRLVSTSLIEAGVDVSFPLVLRAAAGIDSIAQAAGRCNRNGEMDGQLGEVLVFRSEREGPEAVEQFAKIGRKVLASGLDPIGQVAVEMYFRELWSEYGVDALDTAMVGENAAIAGILEAIERSGMGNCPFEDIEAAFRLVEDGQKSVVIRDGRYGVSAGKLNDLRFGSPGAAARALQSYTITVPYSVWDGLWNTGAVAWWARDAFDEQFAMLQTSALYDDKAGMAVNGFDSAGGIY